MHTGKLTLSRLESKNINPESANQEVDLKEAFSGFWIDLRNGWQNETGIEKKSLRESLHSELHSPSA